MHAIYKLVTRESVLKHLITPRKIKNYNCITPTECLCLAWAHIYTNKKKVCVFRFKGRVRRAVAYIRLCFFVSLEIIID